MSAIIKAVMTEKSMHQTESGCYTFVVAPDATKFTIMADVKRLYKVDPISVNIINIPGKLKRRGKSVGKRSDIHKAIVRLKAGQKIAEYSVGE